MSRAEPRLLKRGSRLQTMLVVPALVAAAGLTWWFTRADPAKLCEQGLLVGRRDPVAGEQLIRRSLAASSERNPDAEAALCVMLARQSRWEAAESQFAAVDRQICRTDLLLAYGREALAEGRESTAVEALAAVRRRHNGDSPAALKELIAYFQSLGRSDDLVLVARELARLEPREPVHWKLLIDTLAAAVRREPECLAAIREAQSQDLPAEFRDVFEYRLIEQLIVCGDAPAARRELEVLRSRDSASFRWLACETDVLRLEGRLDEALAVMNGLYPETRDRFLACLNRGVILLDLGRYEEALADLDKAVAERPFDPAAHFKLAEACRGLGRDEAAKLHREQATLIGEKRNEIGILENQLGRDTDDRWRYARLADLYRELHDEETARQWEARATRPDRSQPGPRPD